MAVLVLNAGSSSVKFSLFEGETCQRRGLIDRLGAGDTSGQAHFRVQDEGGATVFAGDISAATHDDAVVHLLAWLRRDAPGRKLAAVGHRVVHGGDRFTTPVLVDDDVLAHLATLIPLAPLHQPHALGPMRQLRRHQPDLPQVACFDTAFHATQPALERLYALPRPYAEKGVKKYGFHGLSYEYIASQLGQIDPRAARGKVVVFHLGNGASLCALEAGRSVASTMGFTPLEGLVMGTRSGRIDPGVLLYLVEQEKLGAEGLSDLLYKRSGLLGVSGESGDMRDLLSSGSAAAREAIELFCLRAAQELGALVMTLGGLDAIIFTAGIGEHAPAIRDAICQRALWLGVRLDPAANARNQPRLHRADSTVAVYVTATNEELMIVRHVGRTLTRS